MFKKVNRIISNVTDLSNYIDGIDIYNSNLLYKLSDPTLSVDYYEITVYEKRPDLIARDFYGSDNYMGILMYQVKGGIESLTRGTVLKLITKEEINEILSKM